jgi:UDP-2,4-diacetamido-2,4,6-trideoxy-beta-L-altropyranose hydrolase
MTRAAPRVMFRADASAEVGAGHVMRCLALAATLRQRGAATAFASRTLPPALAQALGVQGIALHALAAAEDDARASAAVASRMAADAVVVDHYGLGAAWECSQRGAGRHVLAIDDLADRAHDADILLDQNLGRSAADYARWLPADRTCLIGPGYALLRPEFASARAASLAARAHGALRHVAISLGGGDPQDATLHVLRALAGAGLPGGLRLSVVLGPLAPTFRQARELAAALPCAVDVLSAVDNMAGLLAGADLAIGAAGGSAWERCCLGLPTLLLVLADNQRAGAAALAAAGAARLLGGLDQLPRTLPAALRELHQDNDALRAMSRAAAAVTDGLGAQRVTDMLLARL